MEPDPAWNSIRREVMPSRGWILLLAATSTLLGGSMANGARAADAGERALPTTVSQDSDDVAHARLIQSWNRETLVRGEKLYRTLCVSCHGTPEQPGSLPASRAFWREPFKNGTDPFSIYHTIGSGLGQMPAWPWLSAELRYNVIHYIRETFIKPANPAAYFEVTLAYLDGLPKGTGKPAKKSLELIEFEKGPNYLRMNFGPFLNWTYEVAPGNIAYKGIAVRLDDGPGGISKGGVWMLYDHDTMRIATAWTGDQFVDWKGIAFDGSHQTHTRIVGDKAFINPVGPGWADPETGGFEDPRLHGLDGKPYGPLPRPWIHFRGTYLNGNKVILACTVGDAEVLEQPGYEGGGRNLAFTRMLNVGKSSKDLWLRLCPSSAPAILVGRSDAQLVERDGFRILHIPATATPMKVKALIGHTSASPDPSSLFALSVVSPSAADLRPFLNGGAPHWNVDLVTQGKLGNEKGPFAVDAIPYPPDDINPWQSWMRLSGFDFFKDGKRAAVCTWLGDVWLVSGLDDDLNQVTWRRIASGLFQPLGVKIVDETIYVGCRDQIARLHDLNGDGEMDFYDCFNNDHQVTEHFHEFAMGLQTDREGNFYYAKSARHALPPLVPHHGTLLRVSRDGSRTEIVASGFRAANGVCVNDDDTFFVTDQEGHWTPKNRINWVRPGKFYGNMWAYHHPENVADDAMEPPLVWITNDMDRSPGEIVRVTSDRWGPLKDSILNLSYGTGRIFLVPHERVGGRLQGGVVQLPIPDFPTGVMRGRFHPANGQLYACGMFAWAGNQTQDGGFFRVRRTAQPIHLPIGLHVTRNGIELTFTDSLNRASVQDPNHYAVKIWSLKRTADYGSKHYDEQALKVSEATLAEDNKTVRLRIPEIRPSWCMEIRFDLRGADGTVFSRKIHNTILQLSEPNSGTSRPSVR